MRRPDAGTANLLERLLELLGIEPFALGKVGLHAQSGQRRLELMRCIGQESFLGGDRILQPRQQAVDRRHQRRHFQWHGLVVERAQVVRLARANALLQLRQRLDAAHQRQPHQQHGQRQDDELGQHHALDDFGRQHRALFAGLGDLDQRRLRIGQVQLDPGVGDPHVEAAHLVVAQPDLADHRLLFLVRAGKVLLATEQLALGAEHLVVDEVGVVGAQDLARWLRQVEHDPAVLHRHQLRQRLHVVFQRPVERLAGDALRHQPGQRQADRPQQQQRRQHPVEDFAEQRPLLALENLHRAAG